LLLFLLDTPAAGSAQAAEEQPTADVAIFEVPDGPSTLILRAPVGASYRIRFRTDGRWGEPLDVTASDDESPDQTDSTAAIAVGPIRVDAGADRVEVTVLAGPSSTIEPTFLPDAPTGTGDGDAEGADPAPMVAGRSQVGPGEQPAIMPRSAWAADGWAYDTAGCENGPSYADNVQAVVVHHTVTTNGYQQDDVDDLLRAIYHAHVRVNGWCDIGYNFVVDRFGTIWEARTGGIDRPVIGGHAKGFNTGTAGVALLGQHHPGASPRAVVPTNDAGAAVTALASWKLGIHGVDPTGTTWLKNRSSRGAQRHASGRWHLVSTVVGHRDLGTTSCPGNHGLALARDLPQRLAPNHPGPAPYSWEAWQPADIGAGFVVLDSDGNLRPAGTATLPGIGAPATDQSGWAPVLPARAVAVRPGSGGAAAGYVLAADGSLAAFGGAAAVQGRALGSAAVDLALGETGGWLIAADGTIAGFGGRPDLSSAPGSGSPIVAADLDPAGNGYLLESGGRLRPVGDAPAVTLNDVGPRSDVVAVDLAVRPPGAARTGGADRRWGGWVLDTTGAVHPFGHAPTVELTAPRGPSGDRAVTAVVASASGFGGWVLTADGQLWPFGHERLVLPSVTLPRAAGDGGVDVAALSPVVTGESANSATVRYLDAVVELFLGRPATPNDLDHWEARHTYDTAPGGGRGAVTRGLARTDEWAGQRVDALYQDVLDRPAEPDGRGYWVDAIADGLRLEQVGVYFYGSPEYVAAAGSAEAYVDQLFAALLARPADPAGRRYWSDLLTSGRASPAEVSAGFYASIESRRGRVRELYQVVLGREPDRGGLDYWTGRLLDFDDILLAAELAASDEFYDQHT
jgi:hypothetical protein